MEKNKPRVSLVIPARGRELLLQRTIDCAISGAVNDVEIIVVDNGLQVDAPCGSGVRVVKCGTGGTGPARHAGVMAASTPVVVTIDAHVKLCDGWDDYVLEHFEAKAWSKTVACGHVGVLLPDFSIEKEACYTGARLHWSESVGTEIRPLAAKWETNKFGSQIGAVMGAFYAFKKSWYEKIGCPWSVFTSWGCDEEIISLASWLSGGDCRLMAEHVRSYHLFGHAERISYSFEEVVVISRNRLLLYKIFPFSEVDVAALVKKHPQLGGCVLEKNQQAFADRYLGKSEALSDYLHKYVIGYQEWCDSLPKKTADLCAQKRKPPQRLPARPLDRCDQCDAVKSFVVVRTDDGVRRYKCKYCGRNAWRNRPEDLLQFSINNG